MNNLDKEMLEILKSIQGDIKTINVKLDEHTQILKALEHSSEVHKAQMDKMELSVARLEGDVKSIKEDISTIECVTSKNWNDIAKLKAVK